MKQQVELTCGICGKITIHIQMPLTRIGNVVTSTTFVCKEPGHYKKARRQAKKQKKAA